MKYCKNTEKRMKGLWITRYNNIFSRQKLIPELNY